MYNLYLKEGPSTVIAYCMLIIFSSILKIGIRFPLLEGYFVLLTTLY